MDIITCFQHTNQPAVLKRNNIFVFEQTHTHNENRNYILKYLYYISIFGCFFFLIVSIAILQSRFQISIQKIDFWEEPSLNLAMKEYAFKNQEEVENVALNVENTGILLPTVEFKTYTIKKNDTLSSIINKFGLKNIGTLISVNKISNVKKIKLGDAIKVPNIDGILYYAEKGDSLSVIASKFKIPLTVLLDCNDLQTENIITGQKIFIPGAVISNFALKKALGELFTAPVNGRLTSPFGYRRDPFTGKRSFHTGIDISCNIGTPAKSTLDGTVAFTGVSPIYGKYIIISHDGGYQSMYGHLSSIIMKRGQTVLQGSTIGYTGNSGRSTGPHLHFSIYKNGKLIDPLSVLNTKFK